MSEMISETKDNASGVPANGATNGTSNEAIPEPSAATTAAPNNATQEDLPAESLRVRVKIWTDPATGRRYLMPTAIMHDARSGILTAYAMTDEDTKTVKLTAVEWNALPFFYFQEDGPAPRASARPPDAIR